MLTMNNLSLILAFAIPFVVTCALTAVLIPFFHKKQFGQYIREEGPKGHLKKAGTPTMGGVAIVIGILIGVLIGERSVDSLFVILTMLAFAAIGFLDDFEKIAKKNNLGLTAKQKIVLQVIFSLAIGIYMMQREGGEEIFIPFAKVFLSLGVLYLPFVIFTEVAMSNAVNLTDGLDGLASGVTLIVAVTLSLVGWHRDEGVLLYTGAAIAGALLAFLVFNHYPARIFMGDTGSMALGGVLSAAAIVTKTELLLPICGLIYVIEALSVIIQVVYFRRTGGKRFFRMAPIHHHFEEGGMKETKVVLLFMIFTFVCCAITYLAAK